MPVTTKAVTTKAGDDKGGDDKRPVTTKAGDDKGRTWEENGLDERDAFGYSRRQFV